MTMVFKLLTTIYSSIDLQLLILAIHLPAVIGPLPSEDVKGLAAWTPTWENMVWQALSKAGSSVAWKDARKPSCSGCATAVRSWAARARSSAA